MTDSTALQSYDFEVAEIRETGLALATQAEALVITDDETDLAAKTVLAIVRKGLKAADARRIEIKAPALAECTTIDTAFRDALASYKAADKTIGAKTGVYFAAKRAVEEAARREAERLEREAFVARAKAEAEVAAAKKRGEEPAPTPGPAPDVSLAPIPVAQAVTKTEAGTVGMVEHRDWEVADEAQIPRKFFILDTARISKEIRAGGEIAGIRVVLTYTPRTY